MVCPVKRAPHLWNVNFSSARDNIGERFTTTQRDERPLEWTIPGVFLCPEIHHKTGWDLKGFHGQVAYMQRICSKNIISLQNPPLEPCLRGGAVLYFVDCLNEDCDIKVCVNSFGQSHCSRVADDLLNRGGINAGFGQHRYAGMPAAMRCPFKSDLGHKGREIAVVVIPVFKVLSILSM